MATAILLAPSISGAQQRPLSPTEPLLTDTPWGDFPVGRLAPGARLRLTSGDGARVVQLLTLGDSTLQVRSTAGETLPILSFGELRSYRLVEVRAKRATRERTSNIALLVGAAAGAALGAVTYSPTDPRWRNRAESMAAVACLGSFVGWYSVQIYFARPRWRPVTLP